MKRYEALVNQSFSQELSACLITPERWWVCVGGKQASSQVRQIGWNGSLKLYGTLKQRAASSDGPRTSSVWPKHSGTRDAPSPHTKRGLCHTRPPSSLKPRPSQTPWSTLLQERGNSFLPNTRIASAAACYTPASPLDTISVWETTHHHTSGTTSPSSCPT